MTVAIDRVDFLGGSDGRYNNIVHFPAAISTPSCTATSKQGLAIA